MARKFFIKKINTIENPQLSKWPWGIFCVDEGTVYTVCLSSRYVSARDRFRAGFSIFDEDFLTLTKDLRWWRTDLQPFIKKVNEFYTNKYVNAKQN